MSADRRVSLDFEGVCEDVGRVLREMEALCGDKALRRALGEKAVRQILADCGRVRSRMEGPFQLIVTGDFKRGKSTLINALLGEKAAPTAVTPETVTLNRMGYGSPFRIQAVLKDRKRVELSREELNRDALKELMLQLPAPVEYVDVQLENPLLQEINLIDTPGLGDFMEAFDQRVADYLASADALIYVVSARSPLSYTEQVFLSAAVMPQSFSQVYLVVNMADTLEDADSLGQVEALIRERAGAISDRIQVYMLSSLDEFCRKTGKPRPEPELAGLLEGNFLAFENALRRDVILQRDVIKLLRCVELGKRMLREAAGRMELARNALEMGVEKLRAAGDRVREEDARLYERIEAHKAALAEGITEKREEARSWMGAFLERLRAGVGEARNASTGDLQRYMQFYLADQIKAAVLACTRRHQEEIRDLLREEAQSFSTAAAGDLPGSVQERIADCIADISWTASDTAAFTGDMLLSLTGLSALLGPLYVVGQAIAGAVRQRTVSKKQSDLIDPVLEGFSSIREEVLNNLDAVYGRMKRDALAELDKLYQSQLELSAEAIANARDAAAAEDGKVQDLTGALAQAMQAVQSCRERMEAFG